MLQRPPVSRYPSEDDKRVQISSIASILQSGLPSLIQFTSLFVASVVSAIGLVGFPEANGGVDRTVGHAVADEETRRRASTPSWSIPPSTCLILHPPVPTGSAFLGKIETTSPTSFRYTAKAGVLAFSANVYVDRDLTKAPENDGKCIALVYDDTSYTVTRGRGLLNGPPFSLSSFSRTPRSVQVDTLWNGF